MLNIYLVLLKMYYGRLVCNKIPMAFQSVENAFEPGTEIFPHRAEILMPY